MKIDYILIPQGQEYHNVQKGFKLANCNLPPLIPIPVGINGVKIFLKKWLSTANFEHNRVLLMGLGGSLSPQYNVGDLTLYQNCLYAGNFVNNSLKNCDFELNSWLKNELNLKSFLVQGLTCDRLINLATEKQELFKQTRTEVIDMEGYILLDELAKIKVKLAILRVISDDVNHNIPDLNSAFSPEGKLKPFTLAFGLLFNPVAGLRLIKHSLKALKILEKVAFNLANIL